MKKIYLFSLVLVLGLALSFGVAIQAFALVPTAVKVRVQPSGSDIPSAYGLSGESRTYFGNVEGGSSGTYECMWEFSDGGSTAWATVTDPRYISIDHTFIGAGLKWAILTVRDATTTTDVDSATIEVQTLSVDTTNRQKNSAVDRGLRKLYLLEQTGEDGSHWGGWAQVGQTSIALIAFENHQHNLEASDDDIYKKSVQMGLRWLFNHAYEVDLLVQPCIGDPEGVPGDPVYDDLDNDNDSIGITFNTCGSGGVCSDEGYEVGLAMLAIVNSCEKATAQSLIASSSSSAFVNGMTYWDIIVDAKDFLAYAQTDFKGTGGESCAPGNTKWAYGSAVDWESLDFETWRNWHGSNPPGMVGQPAVLHLCEEDVYLDIMFESWTSGEGWDVIYSTPSNTEWAYGSAADWESLDFKPWLGWHDWDPPSTVGQPAVLHLIAEDVYLDITFESWTSGGNGGGFSYTRATEGVSGEKVWTGQPITFIKPDWANWTDAVNQDCIVPGTCITRQDIEGIFNIVTEGEFWSGSCICDVDEEECEMAGWRYTRNYDSVDNSVSQWPILGLEEAKERWDININPQVIETFKGWLAYSQGATGGFGYSSPGDWENFAKTGAGLAMLKWAGYTSSDTNVQNALGFLDSNWDVTCYDDGNLGDFYAMYAFYKGMKYLGLDELNGRAWEDIYTIDLIGRQNLDGSFFECGEWIPSPDMTTGIALAMLAPAVAGLPPVADAGGPYGPVNAGQNVPLDGFGSDHQDPTKNLVLYEWDFDASDGLWWDTKPSPDPEEGDTGITANTSYPDTGGDETYTVTLRVTDDSDPVQMDDDTSTVTVTSGNVPPVAQTNGPWAGLPGDMIVFDGTSSYDPNECTTPGDPSCIEDDSIVLYEWDIDGDGLLNEGNGDDGTPVTSGDYSVVQKTYPEPISQTVTLRVTDSFGLTGLTSPQVNIVSIALVYGTDYNTCFRGRNSRYEYRLGIQVRFENMGTGTAENVIVTLTQTPTNLTILNGIAELGNMSPGGVVLTGCDPDAMSADIELLFDRRIRPTGDWRWKAEFNFEGKHYIINNLPPLLPPVG